MRFFLILTLSLVPAANDGNNSWRLPVIKPAPDFALIDQDAKPYRLADLKDKVALVSFIFTTCSGSCPATTHRMALVQRSLQEAGLLDQVRLVSITLDPERDTPEKLRAYRRLYDLEPTHWSFLTGPPADVAKVVSAWGMWARPAANGQLDHPSRIFLVDRRGTIREIYNLEFMRVPWVVDDVRKLRAEK